MTDSAFRIPHSALQEALQTSALLGTERRPFEPPQTDGALGELLAELQTSGAANPESALLSAAAAFTLYERAGKLPAQDDSPLPGSCQQETLTACSPRSAAHLHTMLAGDYGAALSEWLEEAARAGKVVPPDQLPTLLGLGQTQASFRPYILPVIGNRGRWLAGLYTIHDQWAYVRAASTIETPDEKSTLALWETGSMEARMAVLQSLRATQPDQARTLIEAVWKQEPASNRTQFIYALRTGLSMADEPFLESALDDKSNEVRSNAADILANLPESRFMHRMIEATAPLIALKWVKQGRLFGGATNKLSIEVTLPQEYTTAMKRDGIEQKPANTEMGERAYWLLQQLSRIPPRIWSEQLDARPHEIVIAVFKTKEWINVLAEALVAATVRHNDPAWAQALLSQGIFALRLYSPERLISLLPPERRDEIVINALNNNPKSLYTDEMPLSVLWTLRKLWPPDVCRAILKSISQNMKNSPKYGNWQVSQSISTFAYSMTPSILHEAESLLTTTDDTPNTLKEAIDEFLTTLQFRRDMLQALNE